MNKFKISKVNKTLRFIVRKSGYDAKVNMLLHVHPGGTPNDAVAPETDYIKAAMQKGYKSMTATEHGGFTPMQTLYDYLEHKNIKNFRIIYGVEAYIEVPPFSIDEKVGHLILLAINEKGKHVIDHLVSNGVKRKVGSTYMLVITYDMLMNCSDIKGNVIATSACVSGAPAIALLVNDLTNVAINKEIAKLSERDDNGVQKCMSVDDPAYVSALSAHTKIVSRVQALDASIKGEATKDARRQLTKAKSLAKAKKDETALAAAERAIEEFDTNIDTLKDQKKKLKSEFSIINKKLNALNEKVERRNEICARIDELKSRLVPENEREHNAELQILKYAEIFGCDNYYVEIQYHGLSVEKEVYPVLAKLARKNNIKLVASNDVHIPYNLESNFVMREVSRTLRFRKLDDEDSLAANREMYVKSPNELAEFLLKIFPEDVVDEAMLNLNEIDAKCTYVPVKEKHYPKFSKELNASKLLIDEANKGILWRYPDKKGWDEEHEKRLRYELDTIINMGFADYLLIVKDFLEYGRIIGVVPEEKLYEVPLTIDGAREYVAVHKYKTGIGIGPGRGSGGGSLVLYLLGITSIDPMQFGLIFERFLNPERVSMPDIDSDFANGVREKCIEYTRHKYGEGAVVGIVTLNREGVKGAIRNASTYFGVVNGDDKMYLNLADRICKKVPEGVGITFNTNLGDGEMLADGGQCINTVYSLLCDEFCDSNDAINILRIARSLEGMLCSFGQHAAGVVIYDDEDITNYVPTMKNTLGESITCMNMVQVEEQQMLKMDFLGLKNLSICTDALRSIEARTGRSIDLINDIPFVGKEADAVFKNIYATGNTKDIFQFESPGMRKYLKQLAPTCIEDIIAMNALYRPGPIDAIPEFIECAKAAKINKTA